MEDAYRAVLLLGFAGGTALYAVLAALAMRARRMTGAEPGVLGLAALGLLWNAGKLVADAAVVAGAPDSAALRLVDAAAFCSTALLPPVLLASLEPAGWASAWRARAWRLLRGYSWLAAWLLTAAMLGAAAVPGDWLVYRQVAPFSTYNLVAHLVLCTVVYRGAVFASPTARRFGKSLVVLLVLLAATLIFGNDLSHPLNLVVGTVSQLLSIPICVAGLFVVAPFRFSDVFIRRAATLVGALVIATTVTVFVGEPIARASGAAARPAVAAWVVSAALWCALLLAFPSLERALGRAAVRWLFRRPDYRALATGFAREADSLATDSDVFAAVERLVADALGATTQIHAEGDGRPDAGVDALVPVWSGGHVSHVLAVESGEGGRGLLSDELRFLSDVAETAGRRLESLRIERERRERLVREAHLRGMVTEAQLRALRAQLNPHFLFNTLNTILDLIASDPARAEAVTERLAEVLRYVLARTDRELISVGEEVDFLRAYLAIERARFGERLRVEFEVEGSAETELVPPLILQPLVENAVRHGLGPKPEGGSVRIVARVEGPTLHLAVEDDGVGWSAAGIADRGNRTPGPGGIGLANVEERLRVLYGEDAEITYGGGPGSGTRVDILIPRQASENADRRRRGVGAVETA